MQTRHGYKRRQEGQLGDHEVRDWFHQESEEDAALDFEGGQDLKQLGTEADEESGIRRGRKEKTVKTAC